MDFPMHRDRFVVNLPDEVFAEQKFGMSTTQELIEKIEGLSGVDWLAFLHVDDWPNCRRMQHVTEDLFLLDNLNHDECVEEIVQKLFDLSMTSNLAMVSAGALSTGKFVLRLYVAPSPDHQTNISPEVVEAILKKVNDHDDD